MGANVRDSETFKPVEASLKNNIKVVVRPLGPEDGPALGDFYEAVPKEDFHYYCPHPLTREKAMEKAGHSQQPNLVCLVIEMDQGEIGGYAWYRWKSPEAERSGFGMCIRRNFQNLGVGKALLGHILEIAARRGPAIITLTVQKSNPRAVALYKKMGFQIVRDQVRNDREPEFYMEWKRS